MFCFAFIFALLEAHKSLQTIRKKRIIFSSSTKRRSASSICSKSTVFPCRRVSGSVYFVAGPHRGTAQRSFKRLLIIRGFRDIPSSRANLPYKKHFFQNATLRTDKIDWLKLCWLSSAECHEHYNNEPQNIKQMFWMYLSRG